MSDRDTTSSKKEWNRPELAKLGKMADVAGANTGVGQGSGSNNRS
ncbi:hypothetical protein [Altererythrobacter aquiaggeris]